MRFLKYKTGRGPMSVKRTRMTQGLSNGLMMETLGRKKKAYSKSTGGQGPELYPWQDSHM